MKNCFNRLRSSNQPRTSNYPPSLMNWRDKPTRLFLTEAMASFRCQIPNADFVDGTEILTWRHIRFTYTLVNGFRYAINEYAYHRLFDDEMMIHPQKICLTQLLVSEEVILVQPSFLIKLQRWVFNINNNTWIGCFFQYFVKITGQSNRTKTTPTRRIYLHKQCFHELQECLMIS